MHRPKQAANVNEPLSLLLDRWRADPAATYHTWFLWEERLKNFRSIRRGLAEVVEEIRSGTFGNAYKGSSLETVVGSVAEQRPIFKGADHAWLWKPKLRIPDIYENRDNQLAFADFLDTCVCCTTDAQVLSAIHALDRRGIKGLGPAAANLLYFLHPTFVPPFNTAIVNGYNALTASRVKLGKWEQFLAMREGIIELNTRYRDRLSNDLGAVAALLFDVGTGRYPAPPAMRDNEARSAWEEDLARVRTEATRFDKALREAKEGDRTHTEVQGWLRDLGAALGFGVWIASNDVARPYAGGKLGDGCLSRLPLIFDNQGADAVRLIDVIWIDRSSDRVVAAFEVEHTTSIYSGIVRLLDLALGPGKDAARGLFLVAPDAREKDVRAQLGRPAFSRISDLRVRFLPYGELESHRDAIARFGQGLHPIEAIARELSP